MTSPLTYCYYYYYYYRCDIWACGLAETTEESGPGVLFSEVLFDQFMRIRHADRFWFENYEENQLVINNNR